MEIIKIINKNNLSVKFLDNHGYIKDHVQYINFLRGQVKNPYDITVYTAGYIGVGIHKVAIKQKITDVYKAWSSMLRRCYSESNAQNNKSYYNKVTVCDKWHNFQNFGDWYESNKYECDGRLHVDKDILYPGNKVYSPETCIYFTDRELSMVRGYVFEATDILGNASDTAEQVDEDMENGLGSALRKLYKGCIGESKYAKYKTKRG